MHTRMCFAFDELRKDSNSGDCEASMKTRWVVFVSVFVDVRNCCHLIDSELTCVVRFSLFESLKRRSAALLKEKTSRDETEAKIAAKIQRCIRADAVSRGKTQMKMKLR